MMDGDWSIMDEKIEITEDDRRMIRKLLGPQRDCRYYRSISPDTWECTWDGLMPQWAESRLNRLDRYGYICTDKCLCYKPKKGCMMKRKTDCIYWNQLMQQCTWHPGAVPRWYQEALKPHLDEIRQYQLIADCDECPVYRYIYGSPKEVEDEPQDV